MELENLCLDEIPILCAYEISNREKNTVIEAGMILLKNNTIYKKFQMDSKELIQYSDYLSKEAIKYIKTEPFEIKPLTNSKNYHNIPDANSEFNIKMNEKILNYIFKLIDDKL